MIDQAMDLLRNDEDVKQFIQNVSEEVAIRRNRYNVRQSF